MANNNTSFLPEDYLDSKIAKRTNLICIALFVVMIGAISAAFYVQDSQKQSILAEQLKVDADFREQADQLAQIEHLQSHKQQMIDKAKIVQQLVERAPRSIILAEMINHMPPTLSLLELNLETKTLKPGARPQTAIERDRLARSEQAAEGEVTIAPREILLEVVGVASSDAEVSSFMESLSQHPLYESVGLEYIERFMIEGAPLRRFRVVMKINTDLTFDRNEHSDLLRELQHDPMAEGRQFRGDNGELLSGNEFSNVRPQTD